MSVVARLLLALSVLALVACDASSPAGPRPDPDPDPPVITEDAAALYARMCASCHGEVGAGGIGPSLQDWPGAHAPLTAIIDERMPQGAPDRCDAACSAALATYILERFTTAALACDAIPPSPRRLRMLTRREYRASVGDLLGLAEPTDPAACRTRTFDYDPRGRTLASVTLAGSFNGWSTTAWPMRFDATRGRWTLTRELEDGTHQYKVVLDGAEWVRDETSPDTAPDGFGGFNSVVRVECAAAGALALDLAEGLPVESRSEGFPFDVDADSAAVTSTYVDAQLRAAARAVDVARDRLPAIVGCDLAADRAGCTESFVRAFGRRAFRRPLMDDEVARYRDLALASSDALEGASIAIRAMLVSPVFLYRSEMGAPTADGTYALDDYEIASALSYQLWGTTPDDALLDAAARGELHDATGREREARRLLADARAREPVGDFALMWLGVRDVAEETKQASLYPGWSPALGATMREATRRFAVEVVFDGTHGLRELLTADWGYADESLAAIYGVSGVSGTALARISRPDRSGVLGEASVLATYAHSDQTSPIQRGLFVRRDLLCQSFPPPPADAGGVPDVDPSATTRERFAQHTSSPRCASCHQYIDPIGFGFEGFDAIGAPRTVEAGLPIDTRGDLTDVERLGTRTSAPFSTLPELGGHLADSEAASACFVRQYVRFARGYHETVEERCALRALEERFRTHGDIRELMIDVVLSPDFVNRRDLGGTP